ncbi:MAG: DUF4386 domain-containing protein [Tetrasphaera sp.]
MNPTRRISIIAGTLFIIATAATLVADRVAPELTGTDYLTRVAARPGTMATALLLRLLAAGCSLGIAIALYAVLRRTHPTLALGAVVFRSIEAVFYIVGAVSLMTVLSIATAHPGSAGGQSAWQAVSDTLVSVHDRAGIAAVSAFVAGGLMYYIAFYRTRLVPRWLSGWGIAALPLMAIACCLALYADAPVTSYVPLALPIGIQEIVFGIWLLAKGFDAVEPIQPRSAETSANQGVTSRPVPAAKPENGPARSGTGRQRPAAPTRE